MRFSGYFVFVWRVWTWLDLSLDDPWLLKPARLEPGKHERTVLCEWTFVEGARWRRWCNGISGQPRISELIRRAFSEVFRYQVSTNAKRALWSRACLCLPGSCALPPAPPRSAISLSGQQPPLNLNS